MYFIIFRKYHHKLDAYVGFPKSPTLFEWDESTNKILNCDYYIKQNYINNQFIEITTNKSQFMLRCTVYKYL